MSRLSFNLIAAVSENGGIGYQNRLPWENDLPNEWKYFDSITRTVEDPNKKNVVILGRNTWESLEPDTRPLKDRINILISGTLKQDKMHPSVFVCCSWKDVYQKLDELFEQNLIERIWVAGGENIYQDALNSSHVQRIYLTMIHKLYLCDTFFPEIDKNKFTNGEDPLVPSDEQSENGINYHFTVLVHKT